MHPQEFLQTILPTRGTYVVARINPHTRQATNHPFATIADMAEAISAYDTSPYNVYHACASFIDGTKPANAGLRCQDNAGYVRSLWLDIDVGADDATHYPTVKEGLKAAVQFCQTLSLPAPYIVHSGGGAHLYWVYDRDVPVATAQPLAAAFKAACLKHGLRIDPHVPADMARVLRPVGSHWRKNGKDRPVKLLHAGAPFPFEQAQRSLAPYLSAQPTRSAAVTNEWMSSPRTYPPASIKRVAEHCPAVREVADAKGAVLEPLWRATIVLATFCVEGVALAHEWSQGDDRYTPAETEAKINGWTAEGPPTCSYFASAGGPCTYCPHQGKLSSPIHLGYVDPDAPDAAEVFPTTTSTPDAPESTDAPEPTEAPAVGGLDVLAYADLEPEDNPFWPIKYHWDGYCLSRSVKNDEGVVEWVPFADKLIYPFMRLQAEDGTYCLRVCTKGRREGAPWQHFDLSTPDIVDRKQLAAALAAHEVFLIGKEGTDYMRYFLQDMLKQLESGGIETRTFNTLGWVDGGFLLGPNLLTPTEERAVVLGGRVHDSMKTSFTTVGDLDTWVKTVDDVYNRPGAEPYQFLFLAAFASPLVQLVDSELWHGIPVALTGESGLGKTTTCQAACTVFGPPGAFTILADDRGTTANALTQRIAGMHNLPVLLDEVQGLDEKLPALLYGLSSGKPKDTLQANRDFRNTGASWNLISFITGNMNITSRLAAYERNMAEATQLRCFEIHLPDSFNADVFPDINAKEQIEGVLFENYGHAGRRFLRAVMANMDTVKNALRKERTKRVPDDREMTRERYYYDLLAMALVAGRIARRLGLIQFDLKRIEKWAIENMKSLRVERSNTLSTLDDRVQTLLSDLMGRTVTTKSFPLNRATTLEHVDDRGLRDPIAREVTDDGTLIITAAGLREWCAERSVDQRQFLAELERHDYLRSPQQYGVSTHGKLYPFRGTALPVNGTQCRVTILDLQKMRTEGAIGSGELRPVTSPKSPDQSPAPEQSPAKSA